MMKRPQKISINKRPLIDRPRYIYSVVSPNAVKKGNTNKTINKENINKKYPNKEKRKVTNKQVQQPISGSINNISETPKDKSLVKSNPSQKIKTKKSPTPPHNTKKSKDKKNEGNVFKQMKDKLTGNSTDK